MSSPRISLKRAKPAEKREFVNFNGVRITPPCLIFEKAYEGKTYVQTLTIQNISKNKIVVRITAPTSFSYKVKTVNNASLSPGLSITRKVTYVHSLASTATCTFAIYINENCYTYQLQALLPASRLHISPRQIDFGVIDIGCTSPTRTLVIRNDGTRPAKFCIDTIVSDQYAVIVDPVKGFLQSKSSLPITISMVAYKEGPAKLNLWVKAERPFMIIIEVTVITPKFEPLSSTPSYVSSPVTSFTLVDFPITYEGLSSTQSIYIRNYSSSVSMFSAMGELDDNVSNIEVCRQENSNYNHFRINPLHGVFQSKQVKAIHFTINPIHGLLQPKQVKAIHFTFRPSKTRPKDTDPQFYFCTIYICRVKARYLTPQDYASLYASESCSNIPSKSSCSASAIYNPSGDIEMPYLINNPSDEDIKIIDSLPENDYIKFYLHGIHEKPSVMVVPNELNLLDLNIGQRETRVLEFRNLSEKLPIIFVYKKVAFIDLDKPHVYVKAHSSVQVNIYITPQKLGQIKSQIKFDLAYYDYPKLDDNYKLIGSISVPIKMEMKAVNKVHLPQINIGITPNYMKEVGKSCHELRFNTHVEKPKTTMLNYRTVGGSSSALIGLPNDTQQSIRPWRNSSKCKSIYTKITRYTPPTDTDYELTVFDRRVKIERSNYYTNYMRQEAKRQRLSICSKEGKGDYNVSDERKLLCTDMKLPSPEGIRLEGGDSAITQYLPLILAPAEILNISITPTVINTGPIAPYKKFDFNIYIKNKNKNIISVTATASKFNLIFPEGEQKLIKGNTETFIPIAYISSGVGCYTTELKLILNSCACVLVHLIANVYPLTLQLNKSEVAFTGKSTREYIEIINPLNTETEFSWKLACSNFKIQPMEGIIRKNETLLCYVEYLANEDSSSTADVELLCGGKSVQQLKLSVIFTTEQLFFTNKVITFKNMPLNLPVNNQAILKNTSPVPQCFSWLNEGEEFNKYLQVKPREGVIHACSYEVITLTLKLPNCVSFSTNIKFSMTGSRTVELTLKGNVIYPEVLIHPEIILFKRIPASTYDIAHFVIENVSQAAVNIKFDMSIYPEFAILRNKSLWDSNYVTELDLKAKSAVALFLRFVPFGMARDKFYLPMIINNILGPVIGATGRKVANFLTADVPCITMIKVPSILPVITVDSQTSKAKFTLSKTFIKLWYARAPNVCISTYELRICNAQDETDKFCLRTDSLEPPLYLEHLQGASVEYERHSIVCSLNPQEEVIFKVLFKPYRVGTYETIIPMFVKSDNCDQPHNALWIQGTFTCPTITSPTSVIYFQSIPLQIHTIESRKFILKNHFENCKFHFRSQLADQEIVYLNKIPIGRNTEELWVKVHNRPYRNSTEEFTITISCSCGGFCTLTAHQVIENCYLTNYALLYEIMEHYEFKSLKASSIETMRKPSTMTLLDSCGGIEEGDVLLSLESYPFYPQPDEPLYKFLESCVSTMDEWMYSRGFLGTNMFRIPTGIGYILFKKTPDGQVRCVPPFIQLLINLAGSQIETYLNIESIKDDEFTRSSYIYNLYRNALKFLIELGASFCCVAAEYLMPYHMYNYYIHHRPREDAEEEVMNITDWKHFYRLSKQCWLDVILQTYKVLILNRIIRPLEPLKPHMLVEGSPHLAYRNSVKNLSINNHLFSTTELLILNWLEFHYNRVMRTTWADNTFLDERNVTYFGEHMADGFIYAAVTLEYCPYLKKHFDGLRQAPKYPEDLAHNNIKLLQAWELLHLNLTLSLDDLIFPHPLKTLLISVHLFETLPHLYPQDKLYFKAGLSQSQTQYLTLGNANDFPLGYKAILYGDDHHESFSLKESFYDIQPKRKCTVGINYCAKFIRISQCILILSGDCQGYHKAANKVIELIGEPDIKFASSTHNIETELYEFKETQLSITSPYLMEANYRIQCTNEKCSSIEDVTNLPSREDYRPFTVARCIPLETTLACNDQGIGKLTLCTLAFDMVEIPTWIYFSHRQAGDFLVSISISITKSTKQQVLKVYVAEEEIKKDGRKENSKLFLEIPCQNRIMWNGIVQALQRFAVGDMEFWKDVVYTTTGMHLLIRLVHFSKPLTRKKICRDVDYAIKIFEKNCKVILPPCIHLDDQCMSANLIVPLQFSGTTSLKNFHFTMTSTDGAEIRQYVVIFVRYLSAHRFVVSK